MTKSLLLLLLVSLCFTSVVLIPVSDDKAIDASGRLLLTPHLQKGLIEEARNLAAASIGGVESFTGYFTVNEECGNNLFFWFFRSEDNWEDAPVLLWLNGGPGSTSLYGLFVEIGPWRVEDGQLERNNFTWVSKNNVIFLDQPAGTGFSFTENGCHATNQTTIAQEMYSALSQFFTMFPKLRKNKFFLTGESYAGRYIPALAVEIDRENQSAEEKINLVGIMIGNPFINMNSSQSNDFLYQLGIVDLVDHKKPADNDVDRLEEKTPDSPEESGGLIKTKEGTETRPRASYNKYNVIQEDGFDDYNFVSLLSSNETKKRIHVGETVFHSHSVQVFHALFEDLTSGSQVGDIEYLLQSGRYIVGFYAGQLDSVCPYSAMVKILRSLRWPGAEEYLTAPRSRWYVQGRLAGWVKRTGNLFEAVVRNSGHMVPTDQGEVALELVTAVTQDLPGGELLAHLQLFSERDRVLD